MGWQLLGLSFLVHNHGLFFRGNFHVLASAQICNSSVTDGEQSRSCAALNKIIPETTGSTCTFSPCTVHPDWPSFRCTSAWGVLLCRCREGATAIFLSIASHKVFCNLVWGRTDWLATGRGSSLPLSLPPLSRASLSLLCYCLHHSLIGPPLHKHNTHSFIHDQCCSCTISFYVIPCFFRILMSSY